MKKNPVKNEKESYGTIELFSLPGVQFFKLPVNEKKCQILFKKLKRLKNCFPEAEILYDSGMLVISIICTGKYRIIIEKDFIMLTDENVTEFFIDPEECLRKYVIREISKKYFSEAVEFSDLSKHYFSCSISPKGGRFNNGKKTRYKPERRQCYPCNK